MFMDGAREIVSQQSWMWDLLDERPKYQSIGGVVLRFKITMTSA
jgi:hypothetical protein